MDGADKSAAKSAKKKPAPKTNENSIIMDAATLLGDKMVQSAQVRAATMMVNDRADAKIDGLNKSIAQLADTQKE